jgi:hypothetical protein
MDPSFKVNADADADPDADLDPWFTVDDQKWSKIHIKNLIY